MVCFKPAAVSLSTAQLRVQVQPSWQSDAFFFWEEQNIEASDQSGALYFIHLPGPPPALGSSCLTAIHAEHLLAEHSIRDQPISHIISPGK